MMRSWRRSIRKDAIASYALMPYLHVHVPLQRQQTRTEILKFQSSLVISARYPSQ